MQGPEEWQYRALWAAPSPLVRTLYSKGGIFLCRPWPHDCHSWQGPGAIPAQPPRSHLKAQVGQGGWYPLLPTGQTRGPAVPPLLPFLGSVLEACHLGGALFLEET